MSGLTDTYGGAIRRSRGQAMKYEYEGIEIEISAETQDHAFAGVAKFRPTVNNVSTLLVCGGFFTPEEAEESALAQAKALINTSKRHRPEVSCRARVRPRNIAPQTPTALELPLVQAGNGN